MKDRDRYWSGRPQPIGIDLTSDIAYEACDNLSN